MPRALILGGTGLIGAATVRRLLAAGWRVDAAGRDPARMSAGLVAGGARFIAADRADPAQLHAALGGGADLLVDCVCYTAADARTLLPLAADCASTVMLSAKAVYVDAKGRHVNSLEPPRFEGPVPETQPTMAPGDMDYQTREGYGANKVAAERVLLDSGLPVTVIRPSKVHGPGSPRPREWVFAKRALDRRPVVFLAGRGAGVDHNTAAANIAALVETVAAQPGTRVLNCADPDARSAQEISRIVAAHLGHRFGEILLDDNDPAAVQGLGGHPWSARYPIVLDMTAALALGYVPAGDYRATVAAELDWLAAAHGPVAADGSGVTLPPGCDTEFFAAMTDYAAEDRFLADVGVSERVQHR
ncbi:MAG TPA: NAD-dependent epimerase/dehydratase family protein [Streptosporangiaceae bacterium]|jgi:nucleoside-diphosphate-sugar epimerase